jgi:L-alanine-DL-glutamate epimerase-like enolase superfamily enzyme
VVAAGFDCIKLKGGREPVAGLVERVGAVRSAVGRDIALRLDVNGAWGSVAEALEALEALANLGLEYVEQPLPAALGPAALAAVRRAARVPIAADESVTDPAAARELVRAAAADALVIKPARVGGLRQAWRVAEMAAEAGVPVTISTLFETGIGLAAAVHVAAALPGEPRAHGLATGGLLASDLLDEPLAASGGWLAVPPGPGLGVRFEPAAGGRFAVR